MQPENKEEELQPPEQKKDIPILDMVEVYVNVLEKNHNPAVELRKLTSDMDLIKKIVSAAYWERPIILLPRFSNKLQSLNSLQQKGIIFYNFEDKTFYFTM